MSLTYLNSLQQSLHAIMDQDARVQILGEDIVDPYGGAFKVTHGLSTKHPTRVLSTPISEGAITGVAVGMALRGLLPVVEIMFGDFLTLCMDQLVNHAAKFRGMFNNAVNVPMVLRTPMGGGRGYGPTHSQSLEKLILGTPGLAVVAPSHFHDPGSVLAHSVLKEIVPVVFLEHKLLYPQRLYSGANAQMVTEIDGYPTAIVRNYTSGYPDVSLLIYGGVSRFAEALLTTLAKEEINLDIIIPSSLQPVPWETITQTVAASGRVVLAEESTAHFNWGSEIAAGLNERLWRKLKAPPLRITSDSTIIPTSASMEQDMLINVQKIQQTICEALSWE
ncbi:MAG: alpha-ketoacid dehydrogenase subunit beta [Verrucomicrobiaceae bacterium]|jgi:pyruvate/2-oxoglutarate/acetoin dehydrogenase E1 component